MTSIILRSACLLLVALSALSGRPGVSAESDRLPWEGAWQWLHDSQDGRLVLTREYFCAVFGAKDREDRLVELGDEFGAAQQFRTLAGPMCGSVSFTETTNDKWVITTTVLVAAHPRNVGVSSIRPTVVKQDRMEGEWWDADGNLRNTWFYQRLSDLGGDSEVTGTWRANTDGVDGFMIFADTEYRYVWTDNSRPDVSTGAREMTDAEAETLFAAFDAQGGKYFVSEGRLSLSPAIARDPSQIGQSYSIEFSVNGNSLRVHGLNLPREWTRVEKF